MRIQPALTLMNFLSKTLRLSNAMRPVDAFPLAVFRIILAVTFWVWATKFLSDDNWRILFVDPHMLFKYAGFEWVEAWRGNGMWWHFQLTRCAAVCLGIGLFTRVSAATLALSMAYVILVERHIYNNHDYLLGCTAGLCVFLPCDARWSVAAKFRRWRTSRRKTNDRDSSQRRITETGSMHRWQWWLLRFQLGVPYVFGGIAKLDSDWLAGQPAGMYLGPHTDLPVLGTLFEQPIAPIVMAYGGLFFDLTIVPGLMWRWTRPIAIAAALMFHLTNATIFQIGVFPWFMLATLFVFFPLKSLTRWTQRLSPRKASNPLVEEKENSNLPTGRNDPSVLQSSLIGEPGMQGRRLRWSMLNARSRWAIQLAVVYVVIQLLLPIRPWVLPGNPSWNERGQRFSWRMMLRHKDCLLWYCVQSDSESLFVPAKHVMSPNQLQRAPRDPELIRQAADKIQSLAEQIGYPECRVYALALVSLNGRPPRLMVNPDVDLTQVQRGWLRDDWVLQYTGDLPKVVRREPLDRWWQLIQMPKQFSELSELRPSEAEAKFDALSAAEQERVSGG